MPTPRCFAECPSFPSDVPIVDTPVISLTEIEEGGEPSMSRVFDACRRHGVFLLDLRASPQGRVLLDDAEAMFHLAYKTMDLGAAVLAGYSVKPPHDDYRYKRSGLLPTGEGTQDSVEAYTISQDDMLGLNDPMEHPKTIEDHRGECRDFIEHASKVISLILGVLDVSLGLPEGTLSELGRPVKRSDTSLRLLLSRPQHSTVAAAPTKQTLFPGHTDLGLITMLFHVAGGLQILPAGCERADKNWEYIRPEQGCALINVGDTLVEWTGGVLRSPLHRAVTPPGEQYNMTRVSLAYLVRPPLTQSMRRLRSSGGQIPVSNVDGEAADETFGEWMFKKADQIRRGLVIPRTTGGISIAVP